MHRQNFRAGMSEVEWTFGTYCWIWLKFRVSNLKLGRLEQLLISNISAFQHFNISIFPYFHISKFSLRISRFLNSPTFKSRNFRVPKLSGFRILGCSHFKSRKFNFFQFYFSADLNFDFGLLKTCVDYFCMISGRNPGMAVHLFRRWNFWAWLHLNARKSS